MMNGVDRQIVETMLRMSEDQLQQYRDGLNAEASRYLQKILDEYEQSL